MLGVTWREIQDVRYSFSIKVRSAYQAKLPQPAQSANFVLLHCQQPLYHDSNKKVKFQRKSSWLICCYASAHILGKAAKTVAGT